MEAKGENQYKSIIVPSVQEMVKYKMIKTVPQRYIRSDLDKTEIISNEPGPRTEIPIIDLNRLCSSTSMASSEIDKLDSACKEWGFFQLVNHGIDSNFLDKVKSQIQDLFNLPMEEKRKLWQQPGEVEGFGQAFVVSEEQKLDWSDMFYLTMQPVLSRKPHLFPKLPLPFRDTLETYSTEVKSIAKILLANMARALKVKPEEILEELFDDELGQKMKMNYYPPCPEPDQVIGVTPHSDATGLTILLQVNEVEGLQIKKDGKRIPVKPLPNAFVVNIGDMLEMVTNGTYKSIEHRGVVNSEKERLSVATFHNMGMGKRVGPLRSLVERQKGALFRSVAIEEFLNVFFSRELDGKAFLDVWRI